MAYSPHHPRLFAGTAAAVVALTDFGLAQLFESGSFVLMLYGLSIGAAALAAGLLLAPNKMTPTLQQPAMRAFIVVAIVGTILAASAASISKW